MKEKQKELIHKHEQIRQNSDKLSVGGGVTLWPNMNQMRLSRREVVLLMLTCFALMAGTGWLFMFLHGEFGCQFDSYFSVLVLLGSVWSLTWLLPSVPRREARDD